MLGGAGAFQSFHPGEDCDSGYDCGTPTTTTTTTTSAPSGTTPIASGNGACCIEINMPPPLVSFYTPEYSCSDGFNEKDCLLTGAGTNIFNEDVLCSAENVCGSGTTTTTTTTTAAPTTTTTTTTTTSTTTPAPSGGLCCVCEDDLFLGRLYSCVDVASDTDCLNISNLCPFDVNAFVEGTTCDESPSSCAVGACCYYVSGEFGPELNCNTMTISQCDALSGDFHIGEECDGLNVCS